MIFFFFCEESINANAKTLQNNHCMGTKGTHNCFLLSTGKMELLL